MTFKTILLIIGIFVALVHGPKVFRYAQDQAAQQGEDRGDPLAVGWQLLVILAGVACAVLATWLFLVSAHGLGGLVAAAAMFGVFALAFALTSVILGLAGRNLSLPGRAGLLAGTAALMAAGLLWPIQKAGVREAAKVSSQDIGWFESNYATMQATMKDIAHAPPGVAPEFFAVQREGHTLDVLNSGTGTYIVSAMFILPRGRQWERCWAGVEAKECTAEAGSCSYHLAKDGTKVYSQATVRNNQPRLSPGDRKKFTAACDPRFAGAPYELRVYDPITSKYVFKSDSGFVPDTPQLWK